MNPSFSFLLSHVYLYLRIGPGIDILLRFPFGSGRRESRLRGGRPLNGSRFILDLNLGRRAARAADACAGRPG